MIFEICINFKKNNIIITLISKSHNKLSILGVSSAGICGFKNSKKVSIYSCTTITNNIILIANNLNIKILSIKFKGESPFKIMIIKLFIINNFIIKSITDNIIFPYNGFSYSKNIKHLLNENIL